MKFKHLIVTRFDYKDNYPYKKERIELFHRFCEPSIRNQINKNFLWIILSRKNITINNLFVTMTNEKLKEYVKHLQKDFEWIVTTRFDCDDFFVPTFTEALHKTIQEKEEIIDFSGYRYDLRNGVFYLDTKYYNRASSPFITFVEKAATYKGVYFDYHGRMKRHFSFKTVLSRQWVQIIHNTNHLLNQQSSEEYPKYGNQTEIPSFFKSYTEDYF